MTKYKLINKTNNEEHLCEKVTIDNHDYYVSDEPTKSGDWWYNLHDNKTGRYGENQINIPQSPYVKRLIATTNKSIDAPQVIDELGWLEVAIINEDEEIQSNKNYQPTSWYNGVMLGYNKHAETHSNSDEDVIEFYKWVNQPHPDDSRQPTAVYVKGIDKWWYNHNKYSSKELIQLFKDQQPKVIYYK